MREKTESAATLTMAHGLVLWLIFCAALFLRAWHLRAESAWLDEVLTLRHMDSTSLTEYWRRIAEEDVSVLLVPVYYTLEYCWSRLFGDSLLAMRWLSLTAGLLSIPLLFIIGRRLFGSAAGLVAAACLACSLPHVFYSQEVRRYAFDTFMALLSFAAMLAALDTAERRRTGALWWTAYLSVNVFLIWTSIYSLPLMAAEGLYLWREKTPLNRLAAWVIVHAAATLALAVWIYVLNIQELFWIPLPGPKELVNAFLVLAGGRFSNDNPAPYLPLGITLDGLLAVLLFASIPWLAVKTLASRSNQAPPRLNFAVVLLWLVLPPVTWFLFSHLWKPCFLYRYFLFSGCALYLLAGAAWMQLPAKWMKTVLLIAVFTLYGYQATTRFSGPFRPDYRRAAARIQAMSPDTPILVLKERLNRLPLDYAHKFSPARIHIAGSGADLLDESVALTRDWGELWVVMWRWDRMDEFARQIKEREIDQYVTKFGGMPPLFLLRLTGQGGGERPPVTITSE